MKSKQEWERKKADYEKKRVQKQIDWLDFIYNMKLNGKPKI